MPGTLLAIATAAAAALAYDLGVALQALDARESEPAQAWRVGLIAQLLRRRRWLAGAALGVLGWPLHAGALLLAPLGVVQPSLAIGLVVLLLVGSRCSVPRSPVWRRRCSSCR